MDMRYSIPKMKYKGATIAYQRIKVKKSAKISEVEMTPEERKAMEQRALDEERRKEAIREKEPAWNLYCVLDERLNKEFGTEGYLSKIVSDSYENDAAGDDKDRWASLQENFALK